MKRFVLALAGSVVLVCAAPASAHVTVQPPEAVAGSFARFVVRVPTERDDAATTKVEVQLPEELVAVNFEPKPGWTRTVQERPRSRPVELFGEEVTDYIAAVTWEGGRIEPGEFDEFGFSARVPEGHTTLAFPAIQTYSSGEVVEWIGPEDSDAPAGRVTTYSLGDDQPGQLELLTRVAAEVTPADRAAPVAEDDDGTLGVVLGGIGTLLGAIALLVAMTGRARP